MYKDAPFGVGVSRGGMAGRRVGRFEGLKVGRIEG
jgi:hypothetical protein